MQSVVVIIENVQIIVAASCRCSSSNIRERGTISLGDIRSEKWAVPEQKVTAGIKRVAKHTPWIGIVKRGAKIWITVVTGRNRVKILRVRRQIGRWADWVCLSNRCT